MTKAVIAKLSVIPEKFLEDDLESAQIHSQECLYPYIKKKKLLHETEVHQTPSASTAPVEVRLSTTSEKFLEDDLKAYNFIAKDAYIRTSERKSYLMET